jgi:hypothetical protein
VEGWRNNVLALERILRPRTGPSPRPGAEAAAPRLNISVIFTSVESTLGALSKAGVLAASLGARITLLVPQVVPHPLPLGSPPVLLDWSEKRFHEIADRSRVETTVRIYLCRDRSETLAAVLPEASLVVIGSPKRFWPTADERLARQLRKAGHEVIVAPME